MKTTISSKISKFKTSISRPGGKREISWKVTTPKPEGGRNRRFFQTEADADTFIEQQSIQLANFGTAAASMNERLRGAALRAQEILEPLGLDLVEAAKFYASHIRSRQGGMPLPEAVALLLKDRESDAYSSVYRTSLSHRLNHFVAAFPDKTTTQISKEEMSDFLKERCKSIETRKSYRRCIKTLFSFLIENHNHTIDPVPELEKAKGVKETKFSVEVLTPDECARLLAAATPDTLPSLAIGMFCGLRASEIERLDWKKVNLEENRIIIDASVARKTGSRRVVPIHETCVQWLTPYAKEAGAVQPSNFRPLFDLVRVKAGFKPSINRRAANDLEFHNLMDAAKAKKAKLAPWPSNCLRHSAISYALAESRDESKVASWAGNSPAMIKKHYDSQVMPSAALKFYGILPKTPGNVVSIGKTKAA